MEQIIKHGFVLRLHGTPINWNRLLKVVRYQNLSPSQRRKEENKEMDDEMKTYWNAAVAHVEDATVPHPGDLIDQPFVHARLMKAHEVVCPWDIHVVSDESVHHAWFEVVCVLQELMEFQSQFCACCKEERWVRKAYKQNDKGETFCQRCMLSINSLKMPLFSAQNDMVCSLLALFCL